MDCMIDDVQYREQKTEKC